MSKLNRRNFLKIAASGSTILAGGALGMRPALAGSVEITEGGRDFSPITGKQRQTIPTACWQCVTRDAAIGHVEDGRLIKLDGHPKSIRTRGKLCARGQAGVNQVYFPERILHPLKRVGKRGEHKWQRISWDEALDLVASKLKPLRDAGTPELFMYQYGRHKASQAATMYDFMAAYGTKTIGNHTSVCEASKWAGQESLWGGMYENWDYDNTDFILNFGSNNLEAHTNHIPTAQRLADALRRGVPFYTFDVRLSNTAAKSTKWIPIRPNGDRVVALAMINVIMNEGLYRRDHFPYMRVSKNHRQSVDDKIAAVKEQVAKYTPEYAEKYSDVPADTIRDLARQFAKAKSACLVSYRGAVKHFHGADAERAMMLLAAVTNNLDRKGGRVMGVGAGWSHPKSEKAKVSKSLHIKDGFPGEVAFPTHHVSHQVFNMIKDGSHGRPQVYWFSCYNPAYINGQNTVVEEIFKDEELMPFIITSNIVYDESSSLADLILPDVTYLERWDWEDMVSANQVAEYYIRQPLIKPLGEARCQGDVWPELAKRLGFKLAWKDKKDFVQQSCEMTPMVKAAGGFDYMVKHGVLSDPNDQGNYDHFMKEVDVSGDGIALDKETGVYWNWKAAGASGPDASYLKTKGAKAHYVAQEIDGTPRRAYPPNTSFVKSGLLDFYSDNFAEKGLPPFPFHEPTPEFETMGPDDMHMTTYKTAVHTHSRTAHCKWLSELKHDNPAWINSATAAKLGLGEGDMIRISTSEGSIETKAHLTDGIHPRVIAIHHSLGRKYSSKFASAGGSPIGNVGGGSPDPDTDQVWWKEHGVHPNKVMHNWSDPIGGSQRWMDHVVKLAKA